MTPEKPPWAITTTTTTKKVERVTVHQNDISKSESIYLWVLFETRQSCIRFPLVKGNFARHLHQVLPRLNKKKCKN